MTAETTSMPDVTVTMRCYLAAIALLDDGVRLVTTQQIAHQVGVSCPTTTNMLKRLADRGLVWRDPYHGVRLTPAGWRIAREVCRRRASLERYLCDVLAYPPDAARTEAMRLDGGATDTLIAHVDAVLERGR